MAAEDDGAPDDKPAGEQRKSRMRRQRPSMTIDLTAERVLDKAEAPKEPAAPASPEPDKPEAATNAGRSAETLAEPGPAAAGAAASSAGEGGQRENSESPWTARRMGASIIGSDDGWTRPALAGVAGGIVALILLIVLQAIGLVPSPGRSAALQAADRANAAQQAVADLDRRLSAVEMIAQNLPGKSALDGVGDRVAQIEKELGALATQGDLTVLDGKLAELAKTVAALPPGATRDELTAVAARVARLEAGGVAGNGGGGAGSADLAALSGQIDQARASLKALGDRVAALEGKTGGTADGTLAARAVAIVALRRAVDEGVPFTTDLDLATALGLPANDVAALRPFAEKGVPTKAVLAAEFADVGDAIIRAATQASPNAGFLDRLLTGIGSLVTVRPTGPIAGDDPAAIVSRMRAAAAAGDFQTALNERDSLPAAGKDASVDWAAAAKDRATIDALIVRIAQSVKPAAGNGPT